MQVHRVELVQVAHDHARRDVKDVVEVCIYLFQNKIKSGIYNLGTGKARSFYDLAVATFHAMNTNVDIDFIDIPPM